MTDSNDTPLGFASTDDLLQFNRSVIEEFRANDGRCGGPFEGNPMILLTMTGAKSGRAITVPLSYCADGDDCIVMASAGGSPRHPQWYFNLKADPVVTVERGTESYAATATTTSDAERDNALDLMTTALPRFADYLAATPREIPVIRITRTR